MLQQILVQLLLCQKCNRGRSGAFVYSQNKHVLIVNWLSNLLFLHHVMSEHDLIFGSQYWLWQHFLSHASLAKITNDPQLKEITSVVFKMHLCSTERKNRFDHLETVTIVWYGNNIWFNKKIILITTWKNKKNHSCTDTSVPSSETYSVFLFGFVFTRFTGVLWTHFTIVHTHTADMKSGTDGSDAQDVASILSHSTLSHPR